MHMNCSQSLFLFLFLRMLKASNRCSIKESLVLRSLKLYSDSHLRLSFATVLPKSKDTIHQVLIKVSLTIAIIYTVHSPPQHQRWHTGSHILEFLVPEAKFQCPHGPLLQSFSQRKQLLRQELTIKLQSGPGAAVWRKTELRLSIVIIWMQDRVETRRQENWSPFVSSLASSLTNVRVSSFLPPHVKYVVAIDKQINSQVYL